jgi:hypothetical protein
VREETGAGGVAQGWSACLACVSPWIPSPVLKKERGAGVAPLCPFVSPNRRDPLARTSTEKKCQSNWLFTLAIPIE